MFITLRQIVQNPKLFNLDYEINMNELNMVKDKKLGRPKGSKSTKVYEDGAKKPGRPKGKSTKVYQEGDKRPGRPRKIISKVDDLGITCAGFRYDDEDKENDKHPEVPRKIIPEMTLKEKILGVEKDE